ncbi:hypothetical protein [Vulcanisaeta sp. JCM 14467]|uniref:hypothetical protein n=1 Tax=Vulcanisaeta sp. JCM 14467 TaxID=1295370 RepID=UPI000A7AFB84|nr:hypothetical protein [Vulcanisaeta sp. JCM 14467]
MIRRLRNTSNKKITIGLSNSGIPSELLGRTSVRQLIEVIGLTSSFSHFILTLRALILGDKDLALLHAEVAHLITQALYDTAYDRALSGTLMSLLTL